MLSETKTKVTNNYYAIELKSNVKWIIISNYFILISTLCVLNFI